LRIKEGRRFYYLVRKRRSKDSRTQHRAQPFAEKKKRRQETRKYFGPEVEKTAVKDALRNEGKGGFPVFKKRQKTTEKNGSAKKDKNR